MRSVQEGVSLARRPPAFPVTEEIQELVDGLLLGDGSIERGGVGSRFSLSQAIKHAAWVAQLQKEFSRHQILWTETHGKSGTLHTKTGSYPRSRSWGLRTRNYLYFTQERDRWYPNDRKKVPLDIRLTPNSIAQWYFGDGMTGNKGYHARFATDGFDPADVDFLIERLNEKYGWRATRTKRNRIQLTLMEDRASLLQMVKNSCPVCFSHKLNLRVTHEKRKMGPTQKKELSRLRRLGWSYGKLATHFKMSKSGIAWLCTNEKFAPSPCNETKWSTIKTVA